MKIAPAGYGLAGRHADAFLQLRLFDLDSIGDELLACHRTAPVLSGIEESRAQAISDPQRRSRWMQCRIALRRSIETYLNDQIDGVTPAASPARLDCVPFSVTAAGKPYLAQGALGADITPPSFSISHAGRYCLTMVCGEPRSGVDIEPVAARKISIDRKDAIENLALALGHGAPLGALGSDDRFIQAWCRLEAFAKAQGDGVGRLLTAAGITGAKGADLPAVAAHIVLKAGNLRAYDLELPMPGFRAAMALAT